MCGCLCKVRFELKKKAHIMPLGIVTTSAMYTEASKCVGISQNKLGHAVVTLSAHHTSPAAAGVSQKKVRTLPPQLYPFRGHRLLSQAALAGVELSP
jgi:hypothetical protein